MIISWLFDDYFLHFVVHAWRFSAVIRDGGAIVDVFVIHPLDSKKILGCHLSLAVGVVVMVEKE